MKKILIAAIAFSTQLSAQVFVDSKINLTGKDSIEYYQYRTGPATWGDYDNDGDQDVFVSGKLYRNDGGKSFVETQTNITGFGEACWGDYDNDGDIDLLRPGHIFRNDSIHGFTDIQAGLTNIDCGMVDWGDYDNDGDLDAVVGGGCTINAGLAKIYRNDGSDVFTPLNISLTNLYDVNVEWGDYDNDKDLDLLYGNVLYKNEGNDSFVSQGTLAGGFRTAWVDYDGDNDLDISITGDGATKILENVNSSFSDAGVSLTINYDNMGNLEWGDYDNDGDQDVLITRDYTWNGSFEIFENVSKGVFKKVEANIPYHYGFVGWGDYDNDNDLDFVIHAEFTTNGQPTTLGLKIYENTTFVGVDELNVDNVFKLYPNPSIDFLTLESNTRGKIEIYDISGKVVSVFEMNDKQTQINVGTFSEGLYFVKLTSSKGINIQSLVVTK